jgi:hypothetical protein
MASRDPRMHLSISNEFTRYPGPRYESQGKNSGEKFLNDLLKPRFSEAEISGQHLVVDLDGTEGYSTAFLDGSFGELAREIGSDRVLKTIRFITNDEPTLKDEIIVYMKQLER